MKLYAVFDAAAAAYMPPLSFRSDAEAIRSLTLACRDPNHAIAQSLRDYSLWYLGEFSELTGNLEPAKPKIVCKAEALVASPVSETR